MCARPAYVDAERLCHTLRVRHDVSVVPGGFFEVSDHVRIGLCGETAVLREGLSRLGECLTTLRATPPVDTRRGA